MWVTEYIPAWITSVSVTTLSLLTVSDSALNIFKASLEGEELLSSKALIATFADPIIFFYRWVYIGCRRLEIPNRP